MYQELRCLSWTSFVYPANNRCAEEPAWSLPLGMFLQFVEPITNGSSFRSSTTLSSYMLLYEVSIICTWGYARDDRREVAPAHKKSQRPEYHRQRSGRAARAKTGPGGLRATLQVAITATTLDRPREQTCALMDTEARRSADPGMLAARTTPLLTDETAGTKAWVMQDHLRGSSLGTHAGLASPKLHQGHKCQGGRNLVWANREGTFEVPLVCQKPSPRRRGWVNEWTAGCGLPFASA